ncbi:alpha/beta fold hydrolase [Aureitalea marina]|uniref:Homoserine acetyltransferase n=1 Tax=Aureitalea marina TaxID=930804 RepID=A0A2S7KLX6_9FLAO|nr:alpha/beta fold hydrolase [Aureitalea marina]PQB03639.1 homoserine acetyltransferase [Aureitalea marina]
MKQLTIRDFQTRTGVLLDEIPLSYELFGPRLGRAPMVLVNHALTGNSHVSGSDGWWNRLIGSGCTIDTNRYTVLAFNIPGNGFDNYLVSKPEDFSVYDVAQLFLAGIRQLEIQSIFAGIGGSLGGSILWQMAVLQPELFDHIIPVASDWKASDWLLAQCRVQKQILENSIRPLHDARVHAMTFYRSPESFKEKFGRKWDADRKLFDIESWLLHHGQKLQRRFGLQAYTLMNHLLMTADITAAGRELEDLVGPISGAIHLIGVDSDGFYLDQEIRQTFERLSSVKQQISYHQIESIHGHDAFLIEYQQLDRILQPVFNPIVQNDEYSTDFHLQAV